MGEGSSQWPGWLIGAMLAAAVGAGLHTFTFGSGLVRTSYDLLLVARHDWPIAPKVPVPEEAVMVYLDEESYTALQQDPTFILDRKFHARLIDRLTQAGARAIVFDVVFKAPHPFYPEGDQAMAEAIGRSGRVILAADYVMEGPNATVDPPFDLIRDVAAGIGSAEVVPDRDLVVRVHTPEELLPSLSWAAAEFVQAPATSSESPPNETRWLNYYGPAGTLPSVSYHAALRPDSVPDKTFAGKVVFVGALTMTKHAGERKDEYRTPFTFLSNQQLFIPGVEIQTTSFLNLARQDWLTRLSFAWERWILLLLGLGAGAGLARLRQVAAVGVAGATVLATALLSLLLFSFQLIWFPWLIPTIQIGVALAWSILFNSIQLYVQKRLYEQTLAIYLSPKLVRKFSSNPKLLQPGAEKQVVTILFTDIAGFTSISESMDSDDLADMMNLYFERAVSECIHKTDGTVAKYLGDAIMAFWNAPDLQANHAERACLAAIRFREQEDRPLAGERRLVTRIGIHTGVANVGNFGSTQRVDYTALGENVNLASRLEGLNKYLGTLTILSEQTKNDVGGTLAMRCLGRFLLKGTLKPIEAHELLGRAESTPLFQSWREPFEEGLRLFSIQKFDEAEACFRSVLERKPEDGPSKFYLEQIPSFRRQSLGETWYGEIPMEEK